MDPEDDILQISMKMLTDKNFTYTYTHTLTQSETANKLYDISNIKK